MNVIAQLEFKLAYYDSTVHRFNHYTTRTPPQHIEKKLHGNNIRMPHTVLNKSLKQYPMKQQLFNHLSLISRTTQVRWTRYTGHCWRSKDKLISNVLFWTPTLGCERVDWLAKIYLHQLCADIRYSSEDLPGVLFTNPSARAGYDTRSIFFKRSLTGFNSEFSFS